VDYKLEGVVPVSTVDGPGISGVSMCAGLAVGSAAAALVVYLITNTAFTGATYDSDAGEQIVTGSEGDHHDRPAEAGHRGPRRRRALGADLPVPRCRLDYRRNLGPDGQPGLLHAMAPEGETLDQRPMITAIPRPGQHTTWEPCLHTMIVDGVTPRSPHPNDPAPAAS